MIDFWIGDCTEINLCNECNGTGAKMTNDRMNPQNMCPKCNYTGRMPTRENYEKRLDNARRYYGRAYLTEEEFSTDYNGI